MQQHTPTPTPLVKISKKYHQEGSHPINLNERNYKTFSADVNPMKAHQGAGHATVKELGIVMKNPDTGEFLFYRVGEGGYWVEMQSRNPDYPDSEQDTINAYFPDKASEVLNSNPGGCVVYPVEYMPRFSGSGQILNPEHVFKSE